MIRRIGLISRSGWAAMTSGVVEQLGMEIIPSCHSTSSPLTSGTTSGTLGSMRNAEPSSMTTAPAATAWGANSRLTAELAEINATSTPSKESCVASSTTSSSPPTAMRLPADRFDAISRRCGAPPLTGALRLLKQYRCSTMRRNSAPTAPVAPTTAMVKSSTEKCSSFGYSPQITISEGWPSMPPLGRIGG